MLLTCKEGGGAHACQAFISRRRLVPPPEGYFPKPIDREAFLEEVKRLLAS